MEEETEPMQAEAGYCAATSPSAPLNRAGGAKGGLMGIWSAISSNRVFAMVRREPLFLFLLVGAAIFLGYYIAESRRSDPIRYTPEIEKQLVEEFEAVSGRQATSEDRARMRDDYIGDELMFREAIARGMYLTDPATRERMVDRMHYLIAGAPVEPTEEQLIDFYASHSDMYRTEPGISFTQLFFANHPGNPADILARLNHGENVASDDFWLGRDFPNYGNSMIRGMFGQQFLKDLEDSQTGRWFGPIRSPRGWHFVRKTGVSAPQRISYADARSQVKQDYMLSGTRAALDKEIAKLKEKYDVEIAD